MADQNEAPSLFELLGPPISTEPGSVYDYDVSTGEMLGAGFGRQLDTNATISGVIRPLNYLNEDLMNIAGATEWVGAETARREITGAGLELSVPDNGISRYELDTIKYLKKRELEQNQIMARNQSTIGAAAGFAGGLAAGLTDPLNIASAFIPIVPEARYAAWVAQASGAFGRAGVRAGVGVAEGVAGAALLEPLAYSGAQQSQLEYTVADSFINVVFGGVMGGGLHSAGGVGFDFFNAGQIAAAKEVGNWLPYLSSREAAANAPDDVKMGALQGSVRALENDTPVDVGPIFDAEIGKRGSQYAFVPANAAGGTLVPIEGGARQGVVAFHGTGAAFDKFEVPGDKGTKGAGSGESPIGLWFTDNTDAATQFAEFSARGEGANVRRVVLDLQNPLRITDYNELRDLVDKFTKFERPGYMVAGRQIRMVNDKVDYAALRADLKAQGYDGIVVDKTLVDSPDGETRISQYVVFDPEQVKNSVAERPNPSAPKKDTFEAEDMETSALADKAVSMGDDLESVASDVEFLDAQINGMKTRELWTKADETAMEAGEAVAKKLEDTASIYRAAAVCMAE